MKRYWPIIISIAAVVFMSTLLVGAAQATGEPVKYIVKPGDTLYRIALQHSVPFTQLVAANTFHDVNLIDVGQVLTIPGDHPAIRVTTPVWEADAASPVTVTGQSDTPAGKVNIRVFDSAYRVIGAGTATGGVSGTYGSFTAIITYTVPVTQSGLVEAYFLSANGSSLGQADARVRLTTATGGPGPHPPVTYVVQPGDNLYRLASRYNTTIWAIAQVNHIPNVNLIYVGQKLIIP